MTSVKILNALEANRRYTDMKEAQGRMAQARRDLDAGVINEQDFSETCDICLKIIRSCEDH